MLFARLSLPVLRNINLSRNIYILRCPQIFFVRGSNLTSIITTRNIKTMALNQQQPFNGIKPIVAFVLGGPGSGKGTQCKFICDEFGYKHLSAGDLLRAERNSPQSQYGDMIERHIQEGKIVPVEVTCSLIEKAMQAHCVDIAKHAATGGDVDDKSKNKLGGKFLIDGFPRNEDNLQGWTRQLASKVEVVFVLFLECPDGVCIQRCLSRGLQGSNRSDDNEVSLKKRLVTYTNDTMPIIKHFEKLNLLRTIDATKPPKEVYEEVRALFMA